MRYAFAVTAGIVAVFVLLGRLDKDVDDGRAVIEFWSYGSGGAKNPAGVFWETVAQRFMDAYPDVRVKVVADIAHSPYLSVLTTRFIGGNPPDVMIMDDWFAGPLAHEGLLMPLEGFIRADPAYNADEFPPSMVGDGYVGKQRYGIPWYGGFGCLFYRTDVFAEAGVAPPQTWDELIEVGAALQERANLEHPFAFTPRAAFWMMPWAWQNGAMVMTPDCRTVTVDTPKFIEAVQFVHDLLHRHGLADPALALGAKITDLWSAGEAVLLIDGSWNIGRYDELYPQWIGRWDVAPLPAGKHRVGFFGGQHLLMSQQTPHPEIAWAFMSFATSAESQLLFADIGGYPPGNLEVYAMAAFQERHPRLRIAPEVMRHGRNNRFAPFYKKVWYELFQSKVLDVVMAESRADIAAAIRQVAPEMQAVADDYWHTHDYYVQGAPVP